MAHLDLAGVSADRRRLLLVSQAGEQFTLDITPALRGALRGETTRIGQLEIQMTSTLRPREIQARIRAGATPEDVATAAQTTVEAIAPYVGPVLAEREHVAQRAQRASVRRPAGEGGGTRVLADTVAAHLRAHDGRPDDVSWDAFRRDDGRWELTAEFTTPGRSGTARFAFDAPGNYVMTEDDDARWLVGDAAPAVEPPRDDLQHARRRRLAAVAPDELPLGDDALDLVSDEQAAAADRAEPASRDEPLRDTSSLAGTDEDDAALPTADETPVRRPVTKKRGRASVPSWDEIMFGSSD